MSTNPLKPHAKPHTQKHTHIHSPSTLMHIHICTYAPLSPLPHTRIHTRSSMEAASPAAMEGLDLSLAGEALQPGVLPQLLHNLHGRPVCTKMFAYNTWRANGCVYMCAQLLYKCASMPVCVCVCVVCVCVCVCVHPCHNACIQTFEHTLGPSIGASLMGAPAPPPASIRRFAYGLPYALACIRGSCCWPPPPGVGATEGASYTLGRPPPPCRIKVKVSLHNLLHTCVYLRLWGLCTVMPVALTAGLFTPCKKLSPLCAFLPCVYIGKFTKEEACVLLAILFAKRVYYASTCLTQFFLLRQAHIFNLACLVSCGVCYRLPASLYKHIHANLSASKTEGILNLS